MNHDRKAFALAFGQRLRVARNRAGYTQEELAIRTKLAKDTLSRYERGTMAPGAELVLRLANACSVSAPWLLTGFVVVSESAQTQSTAAPVLIELGNMLNELRVLHGMPPLVLGE